MLDYTFGQSNDIRLSYRLMALTPTGPGTIDITHVLIRNRGQTDFSVIVTIHAVNAVISTGYDGPYNDMASEQILLPAQAPYRVITFYLTLITQVPSFTIQVDVTRVTDFSTLSSSVATIFGEITPISPTVLQYTQDSKSPYSYQLSTILANATT